MKIEHSQTWRHKLTDEQVTIFSTPQVTFQYEDKRIASCSLEAFLHLFRKERTTKKVQKI